MRVWRVISRPVWGGSWRVILRPYLGPSEGPSEAISEKPQEIPEILLHLAVGRALSLKYTKYRVLELVW